MITITLAVLHAVLAAPTAGQATPSYHRHVVAVLSRAGCNGGTCHGAVQGQNGFRLSLFGADPAADSTAIVRGAAGRRLNLSSPGDSLLLRKATGEVEHGGGSRLRAGSNEYEVLRRWIAAGAPSDPAGPSLVKELKVSPAEQVLQPGKDYRLKAEARFADGTTEDVTAYCSFESLDRNIATVDATATVAGKGVGEAGLVIRYRAFPAAARVLVPRPAGAPESKAGANNFIDGHVLAKLRQLNLLPAAVADDATFLRRAYLDATGELPNPDEVRAFLADPSPDKRTKKIDSLLARPGHAALWTLKFCDLLKGADFGVYADALSTEQDAPRFQAWVRARLEENTPYDVFVERILLATSREGRSMGEYEAEVKALMEGYSPGRKDLALYAKRKTLDLYWQRRGSVGVGGALQVAHTFLGLRLECAQCHRHPHDVWRQEDLLDFANFFMRVRGAGFQGDNEKKFPDAAEAFKRINAEAKALDADVKKRREGDGKKLDEDAKAAKADADKLAPMVAKMEKDKANAAGLEREKAKLAALRATVKKADDFKAETNAVEKRSKLLTEAARRLMQAECRVMPPGAPAKVTSPLGTAESGAYRLLGEAEAITVAADKDPREYVVAWMRKPDNPYFARAIINRVWAHYFGRGLIDPADNLSAFNPATHPELLKELCDGFVRNKYDLRWLHRTILSSRTYQQGSTPAEGSAADRANYAYSTFRRLPAEVLLDALNSATGTPEKMEMVYSHWPDEMKAVEVPFTPKNTFVMFVLETFGRPKRNAAVQCDCEREGGASVFQVLSLANHPRVWEKLRDPAGRPAKLAKAAMTDAARIDELFLASLSRLPGDAEREGCLKYVKAAASLEKGLQGVLWSLINTREFLLQH